MSSCKFQASQCRSHNSLSYRCILGVRFYVGEIDELISITLKGGLIVVPSAPVLVNLTVDSAHREAVEKSDLAITDSGFLILLWRFFKREKLVRISGLKYLRHLLTAPEFREPGATFWIMPTAHDAEANQAWLMSQGLSIPTAAIYIAPHYARLGPLEDPALLAAIQAYRPRFVLLNLGGNVQERLGYYLRQKLAKAEDGKVKAESLKPESGNTNAETAPLFASANPVSALDSCCAKSTQRKLKPEIPKPEDGKLKPEIDQQASSPQASSFNPQPSGLQPQPSSFNCPPAFICTGAAIAFLSGRQANIPPWADRLYLGWLLRSLGEPRKFLPRYWHALRLLPLVWKYGERSVSDGDPGRKR